MTELDVALQAARAAADAIRDIGPLTVRHKGTFDLVTQADLAAERAIRAVLAHHTPDIPILGEEEGETSRASERPWPEDGAAAQGREAESRPNSRWVVDPIDGTTNFVHGVPHFGISVALEVDGESVVGVIHNPARGETFHATRGGGAWRDGERLAVSDVRELSDALCATGFPVQRERLSTSLDVASRVLLASRGIRRFGAASLDLAYVAAGCFDAYFELSLGRWDVAAGILLVREAGGRVEAVPGHDLGDRPSPLATNGWLHDALFSLIGASLRA